MSPIEKTSLEVLSAVLAAGGKKAAAKKYGLPVQTITKLINESFPGGVDGDTSRRARVKFDTKLLRLDKPQRRAISEFSTAMRKMMPVKSINEIKKNVDQYASSDRFKKLVKAMRSNRAKGYGLRLTTYQNPNRISLQVHKPRKPKKVVKKKVVKKKGTKNAKSKAIARPKATPKAKPKGRTLTRWKQIHQPKRKTVLSNRRGSRRR